MSIPIYKMPNFDNSRSRPFDDYDEQEFQEKSLYARRHEGLYESRLESMTRQEDEGDDSDY